MRKIHKYSLTEGENLFEVSGSGFKPIAFQQQNGQLCVWAEITLDNQFEKVFIIVVGTGFGVPSFSKHIGTCQQGPFVWHAYQLDN